MKNSPQAIHNPLVTIAIPTYNRADGYLKEAIQSALDQTSENIEVLISDNASTDNTRELVENLTDRRISCYRQDENIGFVNNWNFALKAAKGDYFLLLCDDDRIDPTMIESCVNVIKEHGDAGLIVTGARVIDAGGNVIAEKENCSAGANAEEFFTLWYQRKIHLFLCGCLFNRDMFIDAGGFDQKYNHYIDVAAEAIVSAKYGRLDVPEVKASFRKHDGSLTNATQIKAWCEDSILLLNTMCGLITTKNDQLHALGMRTSASRCFKMAGEIKSLKKRFYAYNVVSRTFKNYSSNRHVIMSYPPFVYFYSLKKILSTFYKINKYNKNRANYATQHPDR